MILIDVTAGPPRERAVATNVEPLFEARSKSCAIFALCRQLVAAGIPDQPWEARNTAAAGIVAMRGPSIHAAARLTVRECGRGGPRVAPWMPFAVHTVRPPMRAAASPVPDQRPTPQDAWAGAPDGVAGRAA